MIEARGLYVRTGKKILLEDISFTLEEGRIYALLGRNGSGKTTLMKALCGSFRQSFSQILYDGRPLSSFSRKERESLHAILPQNPPSADMTVSSLLSLYEGGREILKGFRPFLDEERRLSSLSGGERQLVFLAFLLSRECRLYCLDEAQSNLDARSSQTAVSAMKSLKKDGKTVLASLHDIHSALEIADTLLLLDEGRLVFSGSREELLETDLIGKIFGLERRILTDETGRSVNIFLHRAQT